MTYPEKFFPPLTQLSEDSLVNQFLSLAQDSPRMIPGGSGPSSSESFAQYDPESSSWRTSQGSLLPEWETYSGTWPRSGMTRSGRAYLRPRLVPHISDGGSSLWPTPTQADGLGGPGNSGRNGGDNLRTAVNGQLNPTWVEWLMGFPTGWTDLED